MCTTYSLSGKEKLGKQSFSTHEVESTNQLLVLVFRFQSGPLVHLFTRTHTHTHTCTNTHTCANLVLVDAYENLVDTIDISFKSASVTRLPR